MRNAKTTIENSSDQQLVEKIRQGNEQAFKRLFFIYYYDLCGFATEMTSSKEQAKDIVQEVFCKLWKRRQRWHIQSSVKAYLFQSVRNETLNQIDRQQHRQNVRSEFFQRKPTYMSIVRNNKDRETRLLVDKVWEIVSGMPERRRTVFVMHRKHGLSYREIAKVLEITRKTVENHMGLALSDIREELDQKRFFV